MTEQANSTNIDNLLIRQELYDALVSKYCIAADNLNWKVVRSFYMDEIEMDFSDPGLASEPPPVKVWPADEWIQISRQLEGFDATQHYLSNLTYDIVDDAAVVTAYVRAEHFLDGEAYTIGGEYTFQLKRLAGEWRLAKLKLKPWWQSGNAALFGRAAERVAKQQAPRSARAIV